MYISTRLQPAISSTRTASVITTANSEELKPGNAIRAPTIGFGYCTLATGSPSSNVLKRPSYHTSYTHIGGSNTLYRPLMDNITFWIGSPSGDLFFLFS